MNEGFREKRTKSYANMRSLKDYTMGILYVAGAAFLMFGDRLNFDFISFDKTFRYIFGALCALYGGWRIYRGYRQDYF